MSKIEKQQQQQPPENSVNNQFYQQDECNLTANMFWSLLPNIWSEN